MADNVIGKNSPFLLDALGQLLVAGNFTASIGTVSIGSVALSGGTASVTLLGGTAALAGGTSSVNLYQVGGSTFGLGQAVMATSIPVAIASNQSPIPVTGSFAISTADVNLIQVGGSAIVLGQAVMGTSLPVAIASNQTPVPVVGAGGTSSVVLAGGTALVTLAGGTALVTLAGGTAVLAGGTALVTLAGGTAILAGGTTSVNLNQVGGSTFGLGQAIMATSLPVAIASNQSAIPVTGAGGTSSVTLAGGTATVTLAGGTALVTLGGGTAAVSLTGGTAVLAGGTTSVNLNQVGGSTFGLGQAIMATSIPVAIASNQSPIPVTGTFAISTADVNLIEVGGVPITLGQAVMGTSLPVAIASNQSAIPVVGAGGTSSVTLAGGTASVTLAGGTALVTLAGGTAILAGGTTSVNINQVGGSTFGLGQAVMATSLPVAIASNQSNVPINVVAWNASTVVNGGTPGAVGVGGLANIASAVVGYPVYIGMRAGTGEIATAGNGQIVPFVGDNVGKVIVSPYAGKADFKSGSIAANTTVAQTITGLAALNATTRYYITSMQFGNTSASTILVTMNDVATSRFIVPAGGGSNVRMGNPLVFGLNSAVVATCSVAVATAYINAQGYAGV